MNSRVLRFLLVIFISGLIGYYIGVMKINMDWTNYNPHVTVAGKEPPPEDTNIDMSQFWTVLDKLNANYYDKTKLVPQNLVTGAIQGMVASLGDPYTIYFTPTQNNNFKQGLAGNFEGIGAELGMKGKDIVVVAPLEGSPAEKAGLKAADTILKVDGQSVAGMDLNSVVTKVRGQKGTTVTLTVTHKDQTNPVDVKIMRDTINVKSVGSWIKKVKDITVVNQSALSAHANDEVAYIQLAQFGDRTNQEWSDAANKIAMAREKDPNIKGVILDVRNNPGGYLTDAVYVASEFIPSGTVVIQDDGHGNQTPLNVSRKGLLTDVPLVVLINRGSASAAEIVSGALRDSGRAKLVGERSFGKGTVQAAEDLGNGSGLHITIARWLTPKGFWVGNGKDGTGLTPDVTVQLDPKDPTHDAQLEKAIETVLQ